MEQQRKHIGGIFEGVVERQTIIRPNGKQVVREIYTNGEVTATTGTALYLKHRFKLEKVRPNVWRELTGTEDLPLESQY